MIDYFVRPRLKPALEAMGVPQVSRADPLLTGSLIRKPVTAHVTPWNVPAADFLWGADRTVEMPSGLDGVVANQALDRLPEPTNHSQRKAIQKAITRRLSLMWGPPGTGKSATCVAMIAALVAERRALSRPVRVAITGPTWVAIDNVMTKLPETLASLGLGQVGFTRLLSPKSSRASVPIELKNFIVTPAEGDEDTASLIECLSARVSDQIVAGTAEQLAQLAKVAGGGLQPMFDFMLIDEASQMDVAHAIVAFTTLAEGAALTVVGDDKQMPPIHPIEAPLGIEHVVGSVYDFFRHYRKHQDGRTSVEPTMLERNYRSNQEIVTFIREAGYSEKLEAEYKNLRMPLAEAIPAARPADWPNGLQWSDHYRSILDPDQPLTAVVHADRYSSQRNEAEAELVSSLVIALRGRLCPIGAEEPFDDASLFAHGIGVVTPHHAQQSAVLQALERALEPSKQVLTAMKAAVDTVERFQGQQKIAMIASFGLGDADQIGAEEQFLYSLNRFNVIASRAKAKLIVVLSRRMADYLPRDLRILHESRLLKHFVDGHLRRSVVIELPKLGTCELRTR